jgi:hypothetical protein
MFVVWDRTWNRPLFYGSLGDSERPTLCEKDVVTIFDTRKAAMRAIDDTQNYSWISGENVVTPKWAKNTFEILPAKAATKQWNRPKRKK